jgi:pimeloyl-ACP methyl ester carboxylesterase
MEVIRFGSPSDKPPLLLIHGSYCGAWVWTRFLLPAFSQAGWSGAAISLRGHGGSEGIERINTFGLADYLEDIDAGTKIFDRDPILVGHSLGGYLAQKYALENPVAGLILLASPSLLGLQCSMQHILMYRPMLAMQLGVLTTFGASRVDLRVIADALFSDEESAKNLESLLPLFQRESVRALVEAIRPDFRSPKTIVPTFALGGYEDAFVPAYEFRYEAHVWKGQSKILHGVPHALMLDSSWRVVMRDLLAWLTRNYAP